MATRSGWFEVDKDGLSRLVRRKGMAFILYELVQNAWDTQATEVHVELTPIEGRPFARLCVLDNDPDGFKNIDHGFVLFADSIKKGDPTKRGRFNLGEKLVLAACETAKLSSTTGTIYFERVGPKKELSRRETKEKRTSGSRFEAELRMTRAELDEVLTAAKLLLPPVPTWVNGELLAVHTPVHTCEGTLATEIEDAEGFLRRTSRKTEVRVLRPVGGASYIYEMGIPVVETDFPWSIDVGQKIPLNADRDNVTPAYRKALGVLVVNEMHHDLNREQASSPIVQEALESPDVIPEAVQTVLTQQYGVKRTVYDPSDPEANSNAVANGFVVIHGGAYNGSQWDNIRRAQAATPAGQLFPTAKPYDPEGKPARCIPENEWTPGMRAVADFCKMVAKHVLDANITVVMENELTQPYGANYGHRRLTFNVPKLRKSWFDLANNFTSVVRLVIHEFGHHYAMNHLDEDYHDALSKIGAKLTQFALQNPQPFFDLGVKKG